MEEGKKQIARKLFNSFSQFSKTDWNHCPVSGLKSSEIFVLFTIHKLLETEQSGVKVSDVSRMLNVAPPTVTQLINGLEEKDCVNRNVNREDRRAVQITLTEKGRAVIAKAMNSFYVYFEKLVDYLGEEQSNELAELLQKVFTYSRSLPHGNDGGIVE